MAKVQKELKQWEERDGEQSDMLDRMLQSVEQQLDKCAKDTKHEQKEAD